MYEGQRNRLISGGVLRGTIFIALIFSPFLLIGCPRKVPAGSNYSEKVTITPDQIPAFLDYAMHFFVLDLYQPARDKLAQNGNDGQAFPNFKAWLSVVAHAIHDNSDQISQPSYNSTADAAFNEIVAFSGLHTQCLNVSGCDDTDLQHAEYEGIHLKDLGLFLVRTFCNQSGTTRDAAADYLISHYSLPPTQSADGPKTP